MNTLEQKPPSFTDMEVAEEVRDIINLDPGLGAYNFENLGSTIQFAKLMSESGEMVPKFLRGRAPVCLAVTMRAMHWGFDPFALAQEAYQARDGAPIGYQARVFTAIAQKAGIVLKYRYEGELKILNEQAKSAKGNIVADRKAVGNIKCVVSATVNGEVLEYETPELDQITVKNSPSWHNDPRQQLAYYGGRGWMRRYRADLMLGAYSPDEVRAMSMRDVTPDERPASKGFSGMIANARIADAQQDADTVQEDATQQSEDVSEEALEIDDNSPAYRLGQTAAQNGLARGQNPYLADPEPQANWFAGFDAEVEGDQGDAS